MYKLFNVTLDTEITVVNPLFSINTNDLNTPKIMFTVNQSNTPINLTNATVRIAIVKPDGQRIFQECTVVDAEQGVCEVPLHMQAYSVVGTYAAELMIYYDTDIVSVTSRFSYSVMKALLDDASLESNSEFQAITALVNTASTNIEKATVFAEKSATIDVDMLAAADQKVDTIQAQVDQLVVTGDSSVEAAQARVKADGTTFPTLQQRLNATDEQLADTNKKTNIFVSVLDKTFGVIADGVADDTLALQVWANSIPAGGIGLWSKGTYKISNTITFNNGVKIIGAGLHNTIINMTDDTKFALNLYTRSTTTEYFEVSGLTINAKYGINSRYALGSDYQNTANPSRSVRLYDIKFVGKYDGSTDVLAGTTTVPSRTELEGLGVGVHLVMIYGGEVKGCLFEDYGIAIENIGCTMFKAERNRFQGNARHIHDERVLWLLSSFGMGADNVYELNDILDATRVGGVTLDKSFNVEFRHNYIEHLDRGGLQSAPELIYCYNADACKIHFNHTNLSLSVTEVRPFIKMLFDGNWIGRAAGNIINFNTPTPYTGVLGNFIEIVTTKWDYRYPYNVQLNYHELYPIKRIPYTLSGNPSSNIFEFDNLIPQMAFTGTKTTNNTIFTKNDTNKGWYLTPEANNLRFKLYVKNPELKNTFRMKILAEGNPATDGGNGRCWVTVRDHAGVTVYNNNAVTAFTTLATATVDFTITNAEALQLVDIDLTNLNYSKIYRVEVIPN